MSLDRYSMQWETAVLLLHDECLTCVPEHDGEEERESGDGEHARIHLAVGVDRVCIYERLESPKKGRTKDFHSFKQLDFRTKFMPKQKVAFFIAHCDNIRCDSFKRVLQSNTCCSSKQKQTNTCCYSLQLSYRQLWHFKSICVYAEVLSSFWNFSGQSNL